MVNRKTRNNRVLICNTVNVTVDTGRKVAPSIEFGR